MGLLIGVGSTHPNFAYDYYYGIEWDTSVANPVPTRIGKAELHASLPVQSLMRRCLLNDDGAVVTYLHANDSTKTSTGANADLTGASGNVMVELPDMYVRFEQDGTKCRALISTQALPGFSKWGKKYVSAYEAVIDRTNNKLMSIVNTDAQYRGGNNNSSYDAGENTLLGRPATQKSLADFRNAARKNRDTRWNCNTYDVHKTLWWLFAIEYCNFNSQADYNAALDGNGYRQGGLSAGVTNLDGGKWSAFNGYNPFVPCGYTNSLGNHTGVVSFAMPASYGTLTTNVPSYRGVENPFGHVWKWTDGCLCNLHADSDGGTSDFFVCDDTANYASSLSDNYVKRGELPRGNGYVKQVMLGDAGDIMPLAVGGGSTTYFCDYFYTSVPSSGASLRGVLFGGAANAGAHAGFVYASTNSAPSLATTSFGSRLCFIPNT